MPKNEKPDDKGERTRKKAERLAGAINKAGREPWRRDFPNAEPKKAEEERPARETPRKG